MLKFTVHTEGFDVLAREISGAVTAMEQAVAVEIARTTEEYVPMLTGSQVRRTRIIGGTVVYPGPYARYLYYGKAMKGPRYGPKYPTDKDLVYTDDYHKNAQSFWFEASKAQNLQEWLAVADKAVIHYLKK